MLGLKEKTQFFHQSKTRGPGDSEALTWSPN